VHSFIFVSDSKEPVSNLYLNEKLNTVSYVANCNCGCTYEMQESAYELQYERGIKRYTILHPTQIIQVVLTFQRSYIILLCT
jgi:hypothetical protein